MVAAMQRTQGSALGACGPNHRRLGLAHCAAQEMTARDKDSLFWWGVSVVNPAHSAPGQMELQHRGAPEAWCVWFRLPWTQTDSTGTHLWVGGMGQRGRPTQCLAVVRRCQPGIAEPTHH